MSESELEFFSTGARLGLLFAYCMQRGLGAAPEKIEQLKKIENCLEGLRDNILNGTLTDIILIDDCLRAYRAQVDSVFE